MDATADRGQAFVELIIVMMLFLGCVFICVGGLKNAGTKVDRTGFENFRALYR